MEPTVSPPKTRKTAKSKVATPSPAVINANGASFATLTEKLEYLSSNDLEQVRLAYRFADEAHLGQIRNSGEPYITHPIAVAAQCAEWKLDSHAVMAALLHDSIEDCGTTKIQLIERFGYPVAELVDGLTKLDKLHFDTREENQAESFRKMLLAMARDVRVILIKLADRTHNMRTLSEVSKSKWHRISAETLEIYAPIAYRLGLNQTYRELQELAFSHLRPWRYTTLTKAVNKARSRRRDLFERVNKQVEEEFSKLGIKASIIGREKTLYSIYNKMEKKNISFAQVTDIYGFRIQVPSIIDCYTSLGVLHQLYKPVPGKFKDHIAISKLNGYQSLHTTLVGPSNVNVEFQIRTRSMDIVAESGVAAHWLYKSGGSPPSEELSSKWLQSLIDIQDQTHDAAEFWDHVKVDLFPEAVYVFTPKGQILSLPRGATVVDFAYAIHSNIGDQTTGAKINGDAVPLRTEIKNGDIIEITTHENATPNPAWLASVRTARARSKIRHYLKTLQYTESVELGKKLLTQALRAEGFPSLPEVSESNLEIWGKLLRFSGNDNQAELFADICLGKKVSSIMAKRLFTLLTAEGERPNPVLLSNERFTAHENISQGGVVLDGTENSSVKYGACCRPIPGDEILGYLGRGEGLSIHTATCHIAIKYQQKDPDSFIAVDWSDEITRTFETAILVRVTNIKGVLAKVAAVLASSEIDINHIQMNEDVPGAPIDLRLIISVRDLTHLNIALRNLVQAPSILMVDRI